MDNQIIDNHQLDKNDNLRKLFKSNKTDDMRKKMDYGNFNVLHNDLSLLNSAYGQQQISNALHIAEKSATKLNPSYFTTSTTTTTYTNLNSDHHQPTTEQLQAFIQMNNAYAMAAQITNQQQHTNNSKSTIASPLSISTTSLTPLTNVVNNRNNSLNRSFNYETPSSSSPSSNSNSQFSACSASNSPTSNFDLNNLNNLNTVNNNVNNLNSSNNSFNDSSRMTSEFSNITNLLNKPDQNRMKLNHLKSSSSSHFMNQNLSNSVNGQANYQQQTGQQNSTNTTANTTTHKRSRRRVATIAQRRAANIRERKRMEHLNKAFDNLRRKVPTFTYEKRLSRIETLKLTIMYIQFMDELLEEPKPTNLQSKTKILNPVISYTSTANCSTCPINEASSNSSHQTLNQSLDQTNLNNLNSMNNKDNSINNLSHNLSHNLNDASTFNKTNFQRNIPLNSATFAYWTQQQQTYYAPQMHH